MSENPTVLVTGVGGPAGRTVSCCLRERGLGVLGADMREIDAGGCFRRLPPATDPSYSEALAALLAAERVGLLVPTATAELPKVARDREAIRHAGCAVFISAEEAIGIVSDEWETARALTRRGVGVPRSYGGGSKRELLRSIPLPILSKPRASRPGGGVVIYGTEAEVPESPSHERVYQELLPGEEYDVHLFAAPGGEPRVSVVLRKATADAGRGEMAVEKVEEPDVAAVAEAAVRALGLEGPIGVGVRRARSGRPLVLDVDARVGTGVRVAQEVLEAMMEAWDTAT